MKGPSTHLCCPSSTLPEPVSWLQAYFILREGEGDVGPSAELYCLASSGSPPITYRLVGSDGRVLAQQRPLHRKAASFSLPLSQTSDWFQCEAENNVGVDRSARILLPQGEQVLSSLEQGVIRWSGWGTAEPGHCAGRGRPKGHRVPLLPLS